MYATSHEADKESSLSFPHRGLRHKMTCSLCRPIQQKFLWNFFQKVPRRRHVSLANKSRPLNFNLTNKKRDADASLFYCNLACKPSSVVDGYQSSPTVADRLRARRPVPPWSMRRANTPYGVASDRVYSKCMLPYKWVSSYLAFPSLPLRAVYFCCTFPVVAYG